MYNFKSLLLATGFFALVSIALIAGDCTPEIYTRKETPITQWAVFTCAVKAWGDNAKSAACLRDAYNINQACANCFANFTTCAYKNCTGREKPCGTMGTKGFSPECASCVMDICTNNFNQCSGLEGLPPSKF